MDSPDTASEGTDGRAGERPVPLGRAQHLVWLAQSLAGDVPLYNLAVTYAIEGALDVERFLLACDLLVESSDLLQSVLVDADGDAPALLRDRSARADCERVELAPGASWRDWVEARLARPLDPRRRLFDCALIDLPGGGHVFYWCQHHLASDGANIPLVLDYLSDAYERLEGVSPGDEAAARPTIPSWFDFLASREAEAGSERRRRIDDYWGAKAAVETDVPVFFGQPFDATHAKVRLPVALSEARREAIEGALRRPGFATVGRELSLFVLMATAMLVCGFRLHGGTALNLGFPARGRRAAEARGMLGMVTGVGFLALELDPADTFKDVAGKVLRETVRSFAHMDGGVQTEKTQRAFSAGINVLVGEANRFAGLPVRTEWHYPGYSDANSQMDLNLVDLAGDGRYELSFDLAASVFQEPERETWTACFLRTLDALAEGGDRPIAAFDVVGAEEREALLRLGTGPAPRPLPERTVQGLFRRQAGRTPEAVAVREGARRLDYAALDAASDAIAAWLAERGVRPGDAVGVLFERSIELYPALLGVVKSGAAFVPLDPTYPEQRLAYMAADSGARLVLTHAAARVDLTLDGVPIVDVAAASAEIAAAAARAPGPGSTPDGEPSSDALYLMYTSGSTGLPKGVVGTHSATLNRFAWMWRRYPFQSDEVCCQKTALGFVDSIWELFGPLLQGVPTVVVPDDVVRDVFAFVDLLESERVTRLVVVPSFLSVLLDSDPALGERLRALEICVVSGEPLPLHVARAFLARVSHCRLLNLYGSTEVTADVTADEVAHDRLGVRMPIGRPIDGLRVYVTDARMKLLPRGCVGEILVGGAGLAAGYHARPELDREKFVDDPFGDGRAFRTGDLGRFTARGLIEHHGRADAQLKVRGHRIESAEVESVALEVDGVRAAVLHVEGGERLFLLYAVAVGETVEEAELRGHLERRLPDYMVPRLVRVNALPQLPNGKIDRKGLSLLLPASERPGEAPAVDDEASRTPTERTLAEIWQRTLGLRHVDLHADFFDLGGNSIAAMRIMVGARQAGIALTLKEILETGTVAGIALAVDANPVRHRVDPAERPGGGPASAGDDENLERIEALLASSPAIGGRSEVQDLFRLTNAQQGILFHLLLQGVDAPLYLAQIRVDLAGRMDPERFQKAWDTVAARHDMLRSLVLHEGLEEPVQVVLERGRIGLEWHDLRDVDEGAARERCDAISKDRLATAIPIDRNPMLRVALVRLTDELTHMVLDWHHILMDGWSLAVLSNEVLLAYAALLADEPHGLPPAGTFRDHVAALEALDRDAIRAFWAERLAGFRASTLLSNQTDKAAELRATANLNVLVDEHASERLYEFAARCRVTPNTVIQAAWALVLARYNDVEDVLYGFAVTGRSSGIEHYENTVGMFVNSLPMRVGCEGSQSILDWLQAIQRDQMAIFEHENSALVDVQGASELPPNAPMFDSLLVFQNVPRLTVSTEFPLDVLNRTVHENSPTPLTLEIFPGWRLEIQVMYIAEMFVERPVEQLISHFVNVVKSIAAAEPGAPVSSIGMMDEAEVRAFLSRANDTARDFPEEDVTDPIWRHARETPGRVAATCADVSLDYRALTARADALAGHLVARGLGPGSLVGVCLARDEHLLVTLLAVLRAGAAYVPLDPDYPRGRIDAVLDDARVALLITRPDIASTAGFDGAPVLHPDFGSLDAPSTDAAPIARRAGPDDLAYVIYTSGSTGTPKGVRVTRANMANFLHAMRERPGLDADDALLAVTTVAFDIAVLELFLPLWCGARVDVATRETTFDGLAIRERIETRGITAMQATPTTWRLLLAAGWEGAEGFRALVGGEALPADLAATLAPRVGSLWNMYGPTETTVWSTCDRVEAGGAPVTIGRPVANTEILILDGDGRTCPPGIAGELCIGGAGVSRGYVGREALTREKFVDHPLRPGAGETVYRTGDLARWLDDGRIDCLGRIDDQVKLRGFRIELGEIEAALGEADGIDHAVAGLVKGVDGPFLAAWLVPDEAHEAGVPNELVLRELLRARLPLYMMPSAFMIVEALPRTPNGKIDRRALPDPGASSANLAEAATVDVHDLPENRPASETERVLLGVWEKVLHRGQISVNSNFFDLGGNSISAMQIVAACAKRDLPLTILEVFTLGSIRLCAEAVDGAIEGAVGGATEGAHSPEAGADVADPAEKPARAASHTDADLARIASLLGTGGGSG